MTSTLWLTNMRSKESSEARSTLARAAGSSLLATAVDAFVYQTVLFVAVGRYGMSAALAAIAGAFTNFLVNRYWAFHAVGEKWHWQGLRYAFVSLLTLGCLQGLLWLLVEVAGIGERIAWLPAKVLAFILVSFPLQQIWVFRAKST